MSYEFGLVCALLGVLVIVFSYPQVKLFWRLTRTKDMYVKTEVSVKSSPEVRKPAAATFQLPRGKTQLRNPTFVDFDPTNLVHQAALFMMISEGRMHPTLRFHYDSGRFDNVFDACLADMAEYAISDEAKALAKSTAALKKAQASPEKQPARKVPRKSSVKKAAEKHTVNKRVGRSGASSKKPAETTKVRSLKLC